MALRWIIRVLFVIAVLYMGFLTVFAFSDEADAQASAIVSMAWGLFGLWVIVGGLFMLRYRNPIRQRILVSSTGWRLKFVLFATAFALLEELIATAMTNLAPLFGARVGEAAITASANYFEVIFFHSVIVFIPMFVGWAWLLGRYDFSPAAVFLLFGFTGTLSEWIAFGVSSPVSAAFWVFIYGLMVYLPAYTLPPDRPTKPPRFYHVPLAIIFPILCSVPVALIVNVVNSLRQAS